MRKKKEVQAEESHLLIPPFANAQREGLLVLKDHFQSFYKCVQ